MKFNLKGDIKTGTIYLVLIMITLGIASSQLTQGLFPDSNPQISGRVVTPNYNTPDLGQSNLQLYTFGFITGVPTFSPTATPTTIPSPTPTFIPTLPPLASPSPSPSPTITPTATPTPTSPPGITSTQSPSPTPTNTPTPTKTPSPSPTYISLPTHTPTPTPIPMCPYDAIKPPGCEECPDFEALACDDAVCADGRVKKRLRDPETHRPAGEYYCVYTRDRDPAYYESRLDDPDCQEACIAKPVVYLYPLEPSLIDVSVRVPGKIFKSYPHYPEAGWQDVLAFPDGKLIYKDQEYGDLFFESDVDEVRPPKNGIVIAKKDIREKLSDAIYRLGLKGEEHKDFLEYWIPELEKIESPYIFFSILDPVEKERVDHVEISPKPDTFIAFIAYFKPLDTPDIDIDPLILPENPPERKGFTAVEWGGTIDFE